MKNSKFLAGMFIFMGLSGVVCAIGTIILSYMIGEGISFLAIVFLGMGLYFTKMGLDLLKKTKEEKDN